jgi:hypothetical protein
MMDRRHAVPQSRSLPPYAGNPDRGGHRAGLGALGCGGSGPAETPAEAKAAKHSAALPGRSSSQLLGAFHDDAETFGNAPRERVVEESPGSGRSRAGQSQTPQGGERLDPFGDVALWMRPGAELRSADPPHLGPVAPPAVKARVSSVPKEASEDGVDLSSALDGRCGD